MTLQVGDSSASFPKDHRILKSPQFRWVLRGGRRFFTSNFTFVVRRGAPVSQIGLTVSRKVGNSVQRNRIKRLVRETFRTQKGLLKEPLWIVVIARPGASDVESGVLREQVYTFLRDAHGHVSGPPPRGRRNKGRRGHPPPKDQTRC